MFNLDTHEWDFTKDELSAIQHLEEMGYAVTIKKRYISKDKLILEKDGHKMDVEIPLGDVGINYKNYVKFIDENFKMMIELERR